MRGVNRGVLVDSGIVVMVEGGEVVFYLLKRADDDAAVTRGGSVELGARLGNLRPTQAAVKHAQQSVRPDAPECARRAQPVGEATALEAALGAECECREISCARDP